MDLNLIRILITLAAMAAFAGIVWWAYAPSRKQQWQRCAELERDEP